MISNIVNKFINTPTSETTITPTSETTITPTSETTITPANASAPTHSELITNLSNSLKDNVGKCYKHNDVYVGILISTIFYPSDRYNDALCRAFFKLDNQDQQTIEINFLKTGEHKFEIVACVPPEVETIGGRKGRSKRRRTSKRRRRTKRRRTKRRRQ
jgi:hypothetical protein